MSVGNNRKGFTIGIDFVAAKGRSKEIYSSRMVEQKFG